MFETSFRIIQKNSGLFYKANYPAVFSNHNTASQTFCLKPENVPTKLKVITRKHDYILPQPTMHVCDSY